MDKVFQPEPYELSLVETASKWGHDDGDAPDWYYDAGLDDVVEWRDVLIQMVMEYLDPLVTETHEWVEIITCHNSMRLGTLGGVVIDNYSLEDADVPDIRAVVTPTEILKVVSEIVTGKRRAIYTDE